jgi:hypothetical protein
MVKRHRTNYNNALPLLISGLLVLTAIVIIHNVQYAGGAPKLQERSLLFTSPAGGYNYTSNANITGSFGEASVQLENGKTTTINYKNLTLLMSITPDQNGSAIIGISNISNSNPPAPPLNYTVVSVYEIRTNAAFPIDYGLQLSYPCDLGPKNVTPYAFSGSSWKKVVSFTATTSPCTLNFTSSGNSTIAIFQPPAPPAPPAPPPPPPAPAPPSPSLLQIISPYITNLIIDAIVVMAFILALLVRRDRRKADKSKKAAPKEGTPPSPASPDQPPPDAGAPPAQH